MKKLSIALLVIPLFAAACSSSSNTADPLQKTSRASQALGDQGESDPEQSPPDEPAAPPATLSTSDAGAPPPSADAGTDSTATDEPPAATFSDAGAPETAPGDADPEQPIVNEEPAQQDSEEDPAVDQTVDPAVPEEDAPYTGPCPVGYPSCTHAPRCEELATRRYPGPGERLIETCMGGDWSLCLAPSCPVPIRLGEDNIFYRMDGQEVL